MGGRVAGTIHPSVFINDYFLAELRNSEYAELEIPEGPVVVTTTMPVGGKLQTANNTWARRVDTPVPAGFWAALPGCANLDWGRLAIAPAADRETCQRNLLQLYQQCGVTYTVTEEGSLRIVKVHVPACNERVAGSQNAFTALNQAAKARHLKINAEAGKTSYAEWSFNRKGFFLELVDAATWANDFKSLRPAKER
jgi:hypothetical protein